MCIFFVCLFVCLFSGHPKTKAFISHGGLNSIHQCIYHAVPIVGIPVFGDQKDNFIRLRAKGLAVMIDIRSLTDRTLYEATVEVIYNKTYVGNKDTAVSIHLVLWETI